MASMFEKKTGVELELLTEWVNDISGINEKFLKSYD